jgi:hypothetical protein
LATRKIGGFIAADKAVGKLAKGAKGIGKKVRGSENPALEAQGIDKNLAKRKSAQEKNHAARYETEVESWRQIQSQNIEFTIKRLREPKAQDSKLGRRRLRPATIQMHARRDDDGRWQTGLPGSCAARGGSLDQILRPAE